MSRKKIGLALGGGSVRGLAHIGVLKELEKAGIKVDYIAGTSIGAAIGAIYAAGISPNIIEDLIYGTEWKELLDFTIPKKGILEGRKIESYITRTIGNKTFSELRIPLRIVATDLFRERKVVFEEGSVAKAVRASIAIPGVFSPLSVENEEYVDGGLVDPIPVDVVKNMGADIVIAVDLTVNLKEVYVAKQKLKDRSLFFEIFKQRFIESEINFVKDAFKTKKIMHIPRFISRLIYRILDKFLNPEKILRFITGKRVPKIIENMVQAIDVLANQLAKEILKRPYIDIIIKPGFKTIGWVEFDKAKDVIKLGEEAAKREIPKIRKLLKAK
jgi:NTE family protein